MEELQSGCARTGTFPTGGQGWGGFGLLFPRTKSVLFLEILFGKALEIPEGLAARAAHQLVISGA